VNNPAAIAGNQFWSAVITAVALMATLLAIECWHQISVWIAPGSCA